MISPKIFYFRFVLGKIILEVEILIIKYLFIFSKEVLIEITFLKLLWFYLVFENFI
jgi:hypothetical protein